MPAATKAITKGSADRKPRSYKGKRAAEAAEKRRDASRDDRKGRTGRDRDSRKDTKEIKRKASRSTTSRKKDKKTTWNSIDSPPEEDSDGSAADTRAPEGEHDEEEDSDHENRDRGMPRIDYSKDKDDSGSDTESEGDDRPIEVSDEESDNEEDDEKEADAAQKDKKDDDEKNKEKIVMDYLDSSVTFNAKEHAGEIFAVQAWKSKKHGALQIALPRSYLTESGVEDLLFCSVHCMEPNHSGGYTHPTVVHTGPCNAIVQSLKTEHYKICGIQ